MTAYSSPDSHSATSNKPNSSRAVQGTLTYDVPKAFSLLYFWDVFFNRTKPQPVDSRVGGGPVDSRVTIPQNSRTPGTYGPGE